MSESNTFSNTSTNDYITENDIAVEEVVEEDFESTNEFEDYSDNSDGC